jgi:hypothetical protein
MKFQNIDNKEKSLNVSSGGNRYHKLNLGNKYNSY